MTCPRPSGRRRRILLLLRLSQLIPSARAQYAAYGPQQNQMAYGGGAMPGAMSSGQYGPGAMQGHHGPAAGGYPGAMQAGNYGPAAGGAYAPYTSMAWQQQPQQASERRADVPHILVRTRDALHQYRVCARRRWGHRRSIQ